MEKNIILEREIWAKLAGFDVDSRGLIKPPQVEYLNDVLTEYARIVTEAATMAEQQRNYQAVLTRGLEALESRGRLIDEITAAPPPTA